MVNNSRPPYDPKAMLIGSLSMSIKKFKVSPAGIS